MHVQVTPELKIRIDAATVSFQAAGAALWQCCVLAAVRNRQQMYVPGTAETSFRKVV
jgi:hypothetical protein